MIGTFVIRSSSFLFVTAMVLSIVGCGAPSQMEEKATNALGFATENIHYNIPTDAVEKLVPLSESESWCSKKAEYWLDGKKVGERRWWKNGRLSDEHPMKAGELHRVSRWWRDDGMALSEHSYKSGQLHGVSKAWHANGKLLSQTSYKEGKKNGADKRWNSKGNPVWEFTYKENKLHGVGKYWRENAEFQMPSFLLNVPRRTTFWIEGDQVPKETYLEACKTNTSLPRLPDEQ